MSGLAIYSSEQKRHWRYWVWKRLKEHISKKISPCNATVLFLSGPSPDDIFAATKYGFKLRNIVAVDSSELCVEEARRAGCVSICGSLFDVVSQWNDGQIHGLVADYCCGLDAVTFKQSMQMAMRVSGASCFNFQRGREADSASRDARSVMKSVDIGLHRGCQFAYWMASQMYTGDDIPQREKHDETMRTLSGIPYQCTSYVSSKVVMDTVIGAFPYLGSQYEKVLREYVQSEARLQIKKQSLLKKATDGAQAASDLLSMKSDFCNVFGDWGYDDEPQLQTQADNLMKYEALIKSTKKDAKRAGEKNTVARRLNAAKAIRTMNRAIRIAADNN